MNDLIDTTEMYLKSIIELEEQSIVPLRARIAERLDHSGPTVSQTVARMERDGLLHVGSDRHLELTPEGRRIATDVMRKHRLAERLLSDVVGLEWELVHDEACRWEHVMSEQVERKLVTLLPEIASGPYGNPIPGLDVIGGKLNNGTEVVDLATAVARDGAKELRIAWLAEPLQVDIHLLQQFQVAGVLPESDVEISRNGEYITVQVPGAQDVLDLPLDTASHVFAYKK